MAFKMAKNSLFAILLRSPWWISWALVGVIVLVSNALLAPDVRVFGWMGALPFVVIGGMALKRQWGKPSTKQEAAALAHLQSMSNAELRAALVAGFERQGYTVQTLNSTGADLLLLRQDQTTVVSTQRWKMARPGVEVLKDLLQAQRAQNADKAVLVHLFPLSDSAQREPKPATLTCLTGEALFKTLVLK